jgi:hypothetical protein
LTRLPATAIALFVLLTVSPPLPASSDTCDDGTTAAFIGFIVHGYPEQTCIIPFNNTFLILDVVAYSIPAQKIRFSLPDPPFDASVTAGWNYPTTGDLVTGIELDLGPCSGPGTVVLGQLILQNLNGRFDCVQWNVDPGCEVDDCNGVTRGAEAMVHMFGSAPTSETCIACLDAQRCVVLPPYDLYPPDEATDVPLDVQLSWDASVPEETLPDKYCVVRISTSPTCESGDPFVASCDDKIFSPDFLQPNTTYYWEVLTFGASALCAVLDVQSAPQQSFTTMGQVPIENRTWGRIKSLYE